ADLVGGDGVAGPGVEHLLADGLAVGGVKEAEVDAAIDGGGIQLDRDAVGGVAEADDAFPHGAGHLARGVAMSVPGGGARGRGARGGGAGRARCWLLRGVSGPPPLPPQAGGGGEAGAAGGSSLLLGSPEARSLGR